MFLGLQDLDPDPLVRGADQAPARPKIMCLWVSYKKKGEFFFASLKSLKKGVGSGVDPDPDPLVRGADSDPHQDVTDPQPLLA
jgi:hypothetical protein